MYYLTSVCASLGSTLQASVAQKKSSSSTACCSQNPCDRNTTPFGLRTLVNTASPFPKSSPPSLQLLRFEPPFLEVEVRTCGAGHVTEARKQHRCHILCMIPSQEHMGITRATTIGRKGSENRIRARAPDQRWMNCRKNEAVVLTAKAMMPCQVLAMRIHSQDRFPSASRACSTNPSAGLTKSFADLCRSLDGSG